MREFGLKELSNLFGSEDGLKLWNIARGIDLSDVRDKIKNKAISSGRKFNKGIYKIIICLMLLNGNTFKCCFLKIY